MKKIKAYGFAIKDEKGLGFVRWFNDSDTITADNSLGKLPFRLNMIYIAQRPLSFKTAFKYCRASAKENELDFVTLTETDWRNAGNPIKRFFKKIFAVMNMLIAAVIFLLFTSCTTYTYVVSVKTNELVVTKTDDIEEVQSIISRYLTVNMDSVFKISRHMGYYSRELEIYAEKKDDF